jgi:hypothetical protein
MGCDFVSLEEAQKISEDSAKRAAQSTRPDVFAQTCQAIEKAHVSWKACGVLLDPKPSDPTSVEAVRMALRMHIRATYVPHAGAAAIAQSTRRRIGPVGTTAHQHNVVIEVGQVEKYDNLMFKRYDWQGWHQRMVDIHNRNISVRCKLSELRTLDSYGKPFVDMQSERRMRIVAKDRIGMGIVKLDSDKFEDQSDNMTHGVTKLSQLIADARKTGLGPEYIPSVEVKVRKPSGQSKMHYSLLDFDRVEKKSAELYIQYREAKKKSFFVTPMDMWLNVKGLQVRKTSEVADKEGYTVDGLFDALNQGGEGSTKSD